jgi:hypothetical protein
MRDTCLSTISKSEWIDGLLQFFAGTPDNANVIALSFIRGPCIDNDGDRTRTEATPGQPGAALRCAPGGPNDYVYAGAKPQRPRQRDFTDRGVQLVRER